MTNLIYNVKIVNTFFILFPLTSYVKLQDAYVAEQGNAIGDFEIIGYVVPGGKSGDETGSTTNFTYAQEDAGFTDHSVVEPQGKAVWSATSKANLNDCVAGKNWILNVTIDAGSDGATWESDALEDGCKALTPNFDKVAKAKSSS